ncbi:CobW family GTP-binding protein [Paenibacillus daejeonensis]|uniref:CobW family GTP-binding protein n=1 Tax=Paenibacillus daejeonensis TaxID=135193 RepID=UPI000360FD2A|nr:GTP-binding protein [Paenibacillus daejeonensis]
MSIPVIILSGFLGSGKTTLLLRLLQEASNRELKAAVLMNELGKSDVDGSLIRKQMSGQALEKLLDGCICCSKKSEVAASVRKLIDQQPDVLLVELTGVANPEEVVDALSEPYLLHRVQLKQILTVLDAEGVLDYNSFFNTDQALKHTFRRQMEVADTILINKTDLVSPSHLSKIEKVVKKHNDQAILHHTINSEMPLTDLFTGLQSLVHHSPVVRKMGSGGTAVRKQLSRANSSVHHHESQAHPASPSQPSFSRVQSITLSLPEQLLVTKKQIEQFLNHWKKQLLRAKGYVAVDDRSYPNQVVQYAGKRMYWEAAEEPSPAYLVLIGIDLNQEEIEQDWAQLMGLTSV